ncbi:MAG: MmpS family transport accessory protein, partial [Mycobacterium sp.]
MGRSLHIRVRDMVYFPLLVALASSVARRSVAGWVKGMRVVRVRRRLWVPFVIFMVIGCCGFTVRRVHIMFGADKRPGYAADQVDTKPFSAKQRICQVFGPAGAVANISYFDADFELQQIDGLRSP